MTDPQRTEMSRSSAYMLEPTGGGRNSSYSSSYTPAYTPSTPAYTPSTLKREASFTAGADRITRPRYRDSSADFSATRSRWTQY